MKAAEKKALRARWSAELVLQVNTALSRSTPSKPVWPREELLGFAQVHQALGRELVDLRGFPFYGLTSVRWADVDLRAIELKKGVLAPRVIGTAVLGAMNSTFTRCAFDYANGGDSNVEGRFEECSFDGAKLSRMSVWLGTRFVRCSFRGTDLSRTEIKGDVRFEGCDLREAKLANLQISSGGVTGGLVVFEDCIFDGATLDGAVMTGARFVRCSVAGISAVGVRIWDNVYEDTTPIASEGVVH